MIEDLFERDLAMQLAIERHEDRAQASAGVRSEDTGVPAVGRVRANRVSDRLIVLTGIGRAGAYDAQRGLNLGIAQPLKRLPGRAADGDAARLCLASPPNRSR